MHVKCPMVNSVSLFMVSRLLVGKKKLVKQVRQVVRIFRYRVSRPLVQCSKNSIVLLIQCRKNSILLSVDIVDGKMSCYIKPETPGKSKVPSCWPG